MSHQLVLVIFALCALAFAKGSDESSVGIEKKKPFYAEKAATARWLAHQNTLGGFGTISIHLKGAPFAQSKAFVDGPMNNSSGNIYFWDSTLDTSTQDALANPQVSFGLTEATLSGHCFDKIRDVESPVCARVVFNGEYTLVPEESDEAKFAREAFFERIPATATWPHDFAVYKIVLSDIWLIDIYGGPSTIKIDDYYNAKVKY